MWVSLKRMCEVGANYCWMCASVSLGLCEKLAADKVQHFSLPLTGGVHDPFQTCAWGVCLHWDSHGDIVYSLWTQTILGAAAVSGQNKRLIRLQNTLSAFIKSITEKPAVRPFPFVVSLSIMMANWEDGQDVTQLHQTSLNHKKTTETNSNWFTTNCRNRTEIVKLPTNKDRNPKNGYQHVFKRLSQNITTRYNIKSTWPQHDVK